MKRWRWFLFLFLLISELAFTQSYTSNVRVFTTEDGLSSDKVYALHKDTRGFIWIGTDDGLNRYDGQEFKIYTPDNQRGMTLRSIHDIFEDGNGYLWLLNKNDSYDQAYESPKVNLFNIYTGEITTPKKHFGASMPFEVEDIHFMKMLEDGQLYFYCQLLRQGFVYSASSGFTPFNIPQEILSVGDMVLQDDGNYWIKGLTNLPNSSWIIYKVDKAGNVLKTQKPDLVIPLFENDNSFLAKFDGENYLTKGYNLDAYNHFSSNRSIEKKSNKREVEHINQSTWDKNHKLLWINTRTQIRAVQLEGKVVFQMKEKLGDKVIPILFDGNTIWLSNTKEGLTAINLQPNYFTNYHFFEQDLENSTRGIYQDKADKMWVSTIAGTVQVTPNDQIINKKRSSIYTRFMEDSKGNLWYFQEGGLVRYHLETEEKTLFPMNGGFETWSLLEKDSNEIWFSGHNGVIFKVNTQTDKISSKTLLPSNINIGFHLYEYLQKDSTSFWLCTNQGLYLVDVNGRTLGIFNKEQESANYLPTKAVHYIYKDDNGVIWLATGDAGLLKLKMEDEKLILEKQYSMQNGLSSNSLHAIYEDDFDYLWISSDNGLFQFDKRTEQFTKYFTEQGIPHNEFNRIAHHQGKDGQLYFGGLVGMTSFHPKHFAEARNRKNTTPLAITAFHQFSGEEEKFIDLTYELINSQTINLQASDQLFNLEVAMMDFSMNQQATYQYRIKNQFDWKTNTDGKFSISGLPYGKHSMEIKAFNGSQQEAANDLIIAINVLKPFYLQWWFVAFLLSILALGARFIVKRKTYFSNNKQLSIQSEAKALLQKKKEAPSISTIQKANEVKTISFNEVAILQKDLDWLKQVEQIAIREVKNPNYNIDDLAKELFVSRRQLFRKIKKLTELTPKKYLNAVRMKKAKIILETEEVLTLTAVCYAVGFENTTHFAKLFETEFGKRPHDLLKKAEV